MDAEILDVTGAAELLGVSKKAVYRLIRRGELPAHKVGRVDREVTLSGLLYPVLQAYLAQHPAQASELRQVLVEALASDFTQ